MEPREKSEEDCPPVVTPPYTITNCEAGDEYIGVAVCEYTIIGEELDDVMLTALHVEFLESENAG